MILKYFSSETLTDAELKNEYKKLTRANHPDVGGDEEVFKKVMKEYAEILEVREKQTKSHEYTLDEAMAVPARVANMMVEVLRPAFPHTKIDLVYTPMNIAVTLCNKFTAKTLLLIERQCNDIARTKDFTVDYYIEKNGVRLKYYTRGTATFLLSGTKAMPKEWKEKSQGRRYDVHTGGGFHMMKDKQESHIYVMRDNKAFDLEKLVRGR